MNRTMVSFPTALALLSLAACSSPPEATQSASNALTFNAPAQGIDSTGWNILTSVNSGKVLDLPAFTHENGAAMQQWSANGGTNQQWKVSLVTGNQYTFYSTVSGMVLGIEDSCMGDGAPLTQVPPPAPNALFYAWDAGNGAVTFQNVATGKCLDVRGASLEDGAPIIQYTCNGQTNQQWKLTHVFGD